MTTVQCHGLDFELGTPAHPFTSDEDYRSLARLFGLTMTPEDFTPQKPPEKIWQRGYAQTFNHRNKITISTGGRKKSKGSTKEFTTYVQIHGTWWDEHPLEPVVEFLKDKLDYCTITQWDIAGDTCEIDTEVLLDAVRYKRTRTKLRKSTAEDTTYYGKETSGLKIKIYRRDLHPDYVGIPDNQTRIEPALFGKHADDAFRDYLITPDLPGMWRSIFNPVINGKKTTKFAFLEPSDNINKDQHKVAQWWLDALGTGIDVARTKRVKPVPLPANQLLFHEFQIKKAVHLHGEKAVCISTLSVLSTFGTMTAEEIIGYVQAYYVPSA